MPELLLIDSRDTAQAQALTVEGRFEEAVDNSKKMQVREMLLADHPNMQNFMDQPDTTFICIKALSLVFLNGLTDVYRESLA